MIHAPAPNDITVTASMSIDCCDQPVAGRVNVVALTSIPSHNVIARPSLPTISSRIRWEPLSAPIGNEKLVFNAPAESAVKLPRETGVENRVAVAALFGCRPPRESVIRAPGSNVLGSETLVAPDSKSSVMSMTPIRP